MRAGLLMVGDELVSGATEERNASFIARELDRAGWTLSAVLVVGDGLDAVTGGLNHLLSLSECVIVAGGLGPTVDDVTAAAVAEACQLSLEEDGGVLVRLKDRFAALSIPWTENNAKQARFPRTSRIIENSAGTAPGFCLWREGKLVVVLPGVPGEVRRMVPESILPLLDASFGTQGLKTKRMTLKVFGRSESRLDEIVTALDVPPGISIGFYPRFPEIHLVLTARGADGAEATALLEEGASRIRDALGPCVFGINDETLASVVARLLTDRALTLAVAESCTGGLVTDRLTDVPGSSRFLERGLVAYSNEAKIQLLGVPPEMIDRSGAVSRETAQSMAQGARQSAGTDLGIAVTGIAGPSGGSDEKPVGTVYTALADDRRVYCRRSGLRWNRRGIKEANAHLALDMLRRYLTGAPVCDE